MIRLAYNLVRLALFLLALAFLSFYLYTQQGVEALEPVVDSATKYLPTLLIPVTIAMAVLLLLRYLGKSSDEELGFGDFFAGLLALVLQVAVLIIWRAQGNEISGELATNIPDVDALSENASMIGTLGVAGLQFVVFLLYCIASPDKKSAEDRR
ncbi:MAG: hypothetical protein AAGA20_25010, partial [Planctomycetota bacterium]